MANKKTMEFKSQAGNSYTFQKVSPSEWMRILDNAERTGTIRRSDMFPDVLEHVVVQPSKTVDDFEEYAELDEVVKAAIRFQQGKF